MKAADLGDLNDDAIAEGGDRARNRRVFFERQVSSRPLVVGAIEDGVQRLLCGRSRISPPQTAGRACRSSEILSTLPYLFATTLPKSRMEEEALQQAFGEEDEAYSQATHDLMR